MRDERNYIASSRSRWVRSAWMDVVGRPRLKRWSSTKSAVFLDLTKTRVRDGGMLMRRSYNACFFILFSTQTICRCVSDVARKGGEG